MARIRTPARLAAVIASWALLAAPGTVLHAAMNDHEGRLSDGGIPWAAALAMACIGAYLFRRYVSRPRGGRSFRTMVESAALLVVGVLVLGSILGASGPRDPYASGLAASAICLAVGSLRTIQAGVARRRNRRRRQAPYSQGAGPTGGRPPTRRPTTRRPTRTTRPSGRVPRPTPGSRPAPGQIWFASVPFDDTRETKDRPCLVVGTGPRGIDVLKITSQDKSGRPDYIRMPVAGWDSSASHDSWLELDPPRRIARSAFRRPLGVCDDAVWRRVTRHHNLR